MKRFVGIVLIAFSFLSLSIGNAEEEELEAVRGQGKILGRNVARAKSNAIEDALAQGILMEAQRLLGSEVFERNRNLLEYLLKKKSRELVKNFQIQRERVLGDKVSVDVLVRPERERLRDQLETWGVLFERGRKPQFGFETLETKKDQESLRLSSRFLQRLIGLGYGVGKMSGEATTTEAFDLVFWGKLETNRKNELLVNLDVYLEGDRSKSRSVRGKIERPKASNVGTNTLDLQIGLAVVEFLERSLPLWSQKTGLGQTFWIEFVGLSSFGSYSELLTFFRNKSKGFGGGKEKRYSSGKVQFEVSYSGTAEKLVSKIEGESFKNSKFELVNRSGRDLVFRIK